MVIISCWILVIGTGAYLRFDQLSNRSFHADEATGARITASRLESGTYQFDPLHYHGPTLSAFTVGLCKLRGESGWQEMTKLTPRMVTALAGALLLFVPLWWRRRFGDGPMLLACAVMATSPLLVYFSRMFIHESLLVLFGILALVSLTRFPRYGIPGLLMGLMFATKESFAISIIAWTAAALGIAMEHRRSLDRAWLVRTWRRFRVPLCCSVVTAALVSSVFYTNAFSHPLGMVDAVKTFFIYQTSAGHDKPLTYYAQLLTVPSQTGGVWWFGTPVALLALLGFANSFRPQISDRWVIRFIAYSALVHFLIYSVIAYKTPWLACLPWAHVCLLAGFALSGFSSRARWIQFTVTALVITCLGSQLRQTRHIRGRFASDERNPFAYVPTRNDIETLAPWLKQLQQVLPENGLDPIGVIGTDYWPLPWYLRSFGKIGYWPTPPADLTTFPLVFAMPEVEPAVAASLQHTHTALPRGLRAQVAVTLFLRNDIWQRWQNKKP